MNTHTHTHTHMNTHTHTHTHTRTHSGKPYNVPLLDSVAQEASEALKEWRSVLFDLYLVS